jgi:RNA polymerase sigma-70 factor, ECF subfamily
MWLLVSQFLEEPTLVAQAQAGQRKAFEKLFTKHAPLVHGILLARVPRADADDLMQDVFVTALEKITTLSDSSKVAPWLAMIARNRCIDLYRQRPQLASLVTEPQTEQAPRAEVGQVLSIIRSLPEAYREPLVLRLVEGFTGPEIAEHTGLTPESVRVNLFRGMAMLRERMGLDAGEFS